MKRGFYSLYLRLVILGLCLPFLVFDNEPHPGMHGGAVAMEISTVSNPGDGVAGENVGDPT